HIIHLKRDIFYTVTVAGESFRIGMARPNRRRKQKTDLPLLEQVIHFMLLLGFETGETGDVEAEDVLIIVGGLLGIADVKTHVIYSADWKSVLWHRTGFSLQVYDFIIS